MQNIPNLAPTTEIIGACLTYNLLSKQRTKFIKDPVGFIHSYTDVDIGDAVKMQVVKNSDDQVHLILPCYEDLDSAQAQLLQDKELQQVVGGEIIFSGGVLGAALGTIIFGTVNATIGGAVIGSIVGGVVIAGAVAVGTTAGIKAKEGVNLDGSAK